MLKVELFQSTPGLPQRYNSDAFLREYILTKNSIDKLDIIHGIISNLNRSQKFDIRLTVTDTDVDYIRDNFMSPVVSKESKTETYSDKGKEKTCIVIKGNSAVFILTNYGFGPSDSESVLAFNKIRTSRRHEKHSFSAKSTLASIQR